VRGACRGGISKLVYAVRLILTGRPSGECDSLGHGEEEESACNDFGEHLYGSEYASQRSPFLYGGLRYVHRERVGNIRIGLCLNSRHAKIFRQFIPSLQLS
jgi:hypothetical protein